MNGGGKTELRIDPTGEADFVGHAGNTVRLSLRGPRGVTIAAASYAESSGAYDVALTISSDGQHFSFQIPSGVIVLHVSLQGMIQPGTHSLVEEQNELVRIQGQALALTVRGE